ncbi:hypothetical protein DRN85_04850 [Methanosarcinales archaeon]|nr:MAG: hypothetical protein DRN85_04850 [Methanosarcinales archaeon]
MKLETPYNVTYKAIYAIANEENNIVELIEESQCYGASAWARHHISKGPLVISARSTANTTRYLLKTGKVEIELQGSKQAAGIESAAIHENEIEITFSGLGGGGVGATKTRAHSPGVLRHTITESGGSRKARGTIILPRRERVLIGIDDTDSKETGATWALAHNIATELHTLETPYLSHTLVQLYPVEERTQNCVSTAIEFAPITQETGKKLIQEFKKLLQTYSVSDETGMAVHNGFDPCRLLKYSSRARTRRVKKKDALKAAEKTNTRIHLGGNGIIGALAAIPWHAQPDKSVKLEPEH